MPAQFVRFAQMKPTPWRNGGGMTREVALHSDATLHPDFLWRVSIATVDRDGPFSRFDGVDRSFAVLEGEGLTLSFAPGGDVALKRGDQPFSFPGEAAVSGLLTKGPTTDLNLLTRRGFYRHSMERLTIIRPLALLGDADVTHVVFTGPCEIDDGGKNHHASGFDVVVNIFRGEPVLLRPQDETAVFLLRINGR